MRLVVPQQEFVPHEPGIFPAVCVDYIDLGIEETTYNGEVRMVPRVKLMFETESPSGSRGVIGRTYTASLSQRAKLREVLTKWRGRPFEPNEGIEMSQLVGASCTLVISHIPRRDGQGVYAGIDAISRPTKKVKPSGIYDPQAERQWIAERKADRQPQAAPSVMMPRASVPVGMGAAPALVPAPAQAALPAALTLTAPDFPDEDVPF